MYEAWLRLQEGDIEIAVVTGSGRSSTGDPMLIYPMEMDPYFLAPLGADPLTFAALQARAVISAGIADERSMAEVSVRSRGKGDVDDLLARTIYGSRCTATTCHPLPTERPLWYSPPASVLASWSSGRPISPASTTAPNATIPRSGLSTTLPPPVSPPGPLDSVPAPSRWPSCKRHSATRSCSCGESQTRAPTWP